MTAIVVAAIAPLLVFIYPPAGRTKQKDLPIKLNTPLDQLGEGQGFSFDAPPQSGFVMADGGGDNFPGKIGFKGYVVKIGGRLHVLSATCSHLGCAVTLNQGGPPGFGCPCHGSMFTLGGDVTHGPAAAALSNYTWKQTGSPDQILVLGLSLPGI
jgi:Rieske Fe-S protein